MGCGGLDGIGRGQLPAFGTEDGVQGIGIIILRGGHEGIDGVLRRGEKLLASRRLILGQGERWKQGAEGERAGAGELRIKAGRF